MSELLKLLPTAGTQEWYVFLIASMVMFCIVLILFGDQLFRLANARLPKKAQEGEDTHTCHQMGNIEMLGDKIDVLEKSVGELKTDLIKLATTEHLHNESMDHRIAELKDSMEKKFDMLLEHILELKK
jgi:hypothetical protein